MKRLFAVIAAAALMLMGVGASATAAKPIPATPHITYIVGQWATQQPTTFAVTARAVGVTSIYGVIFHVVARDVAGNTVAEDAGYVPMRSGAGSNQWSTAPFAVSMPSAQRVDVTGSLYKQKGRTAVTLETQSGSAVVANLPAWDAWVEFYKAS
jgi:hypothetical protein